MRREVRRRAYKEGEPITDLQAITNRNFKPAIRVSDTP